MLGLEPVTKTRRGKFPRGIAGKAQRESDLRSEQGIAERVQHERQRALRDVTFVMADGKLCDQGMDGIENWVQRVAVAGENHPRGERPRTLLAEGVEALVDDDPRIGLARPGALHGVRDAVGDRVGDGFGKLTLETGGRPEMMQEIRVSPADLRGNGLERHGLRSLVEQQLSRGCQGGGTAFFRAETGSSY